MREKKFLNQGAVTVEVHTQLINYLINSKMKNAIKNYPLIHKTLIIRVMNITVGNLICASDVYQRIISLKMS